VPEGVIGFEGTGNLDGRQELPHEVQFDHDVHTVADGLADLLEGLERRLDLDPQLVWRGTDHAG